MESNIPQATYLNIEYVFFQILQFFRAVGRFFAGGEVTVRGSVRTSVTGFDVLRVIATILSILLITFILYCLVRLVELKKARDKALKAKFAQVPDSTPKAVVNPRWERAENHSLTDNPNDWRVAIIEADTILDEELRKRGFPGETIGEMLQSNLGKELTTIGDAWEAHKIRNKIAHEGQEFILSKPVVRKTMEQFKSVFQEIGYLS